MNRDLPREGAEASPESTPDLGFSETLPDELEPGPEESAFGRRILSRLERREGSFSRYRVGEEIGHGGMGSVLEVWDEDLRRRLAMKVIRSPRRRLPPGMSEQILARFVEEAQVSGQLEHPGIVPVHELGMDAEGKVFFTMKLVQGRTLAEVIGEQGEESGEWTEFRLLGILQRVCEAVAFAHEKGVVHRDLKPSNVMVGDFGEVYVLDWGLALLLEGKGELDVEGAPASVSIESDRVDHCTETPDSPLLTDPGLAIGTAMYCSPEQARGERESIGKASDVYSLGAILYELIVRCPPYMDEGESPGRDEIFERVRRGPPRALERIAPRASAELVAICERAMAREIRNRYRSVGELAEDLRAYQEGRVVSAHATGVWPEAKKWVQRNRGFAGALAATTLALVAGLGTSLNLWAAERDRAAEVLKERDRLESIVAFQAGVFERLNPAAFGARLRIGARDALRARLGLGHAEDQGSLERFDDALALVNMTNTGVTALAEEILDPARDEALNGFAEDPLTRIRVLDSLAGTYARLGLIAPALELRRERLRLCEVHHGPEALETLHARGELGSALGANGDRDGALETHRATLAVALRVLSPDHPDLGSFKSQFASALGSHGDREQALALHRQGLEDLRRTRGPEHHYSIISLNNVGLALRSLGRYEEALEHIEQALEIARRILGNEHDNTLDMVCNAGLLLKELGRPEEAIPYYLEALETRRRVLGDDHPDTLISVANTGGLFRDIGDFQRARPLLEESLTRCQRVFGEAHENTVLANNNLALYFAGIGQPEEALPYLEKAARQARLVFGAGHPFTIRIHGNLGTTLGDLGRSDEGLALQEALLGEAQRELGPEHPGTITLMSNLGYEFYRMGRYEEALWVLQEGLAISADVHGRHHPQTFNLECNLGHALIAAARHDEARALIESSAKRAWSSLPPDYPVTVELRKQAEEIHSILERLEPGVGYAERGRELLGDLDALARERGAQQP